MVRHKFNAVRCEEDGIKFASKKERKRYQELKILQLSGDVSFFLRQTPIHLLGGTKYVCDYQVFWSNGEVTFEDVKGMRTPMYKVKKREVEAKYPFIITEI
jgi:dsDNA-binding SOS-regulon protein